MVKLTDLPQDILLTIYTYTGPRDLLVLNQVAGRLIYLCTLSELTVEARQTCRTLYTLGTSDYVWHQLKIDLPLDIDQKTHAGDYRPSHEIRHSLIQAFRVEANWNSETSHIRKLARIDHGGLLSQVQLLRKDWLVTLSQNQTTNTTYLSAWHLDPDRRGHCAAKVGAAGRSSKFAAAIREGGDSAWVAMFSNSTNSGWIEVFSLSLTGDYIYEAAPVSPLRRVAEVSFADKVANGYNPLEHQGNFIDIQVNNDIIAASFVKMGSPWTYHIILVDMGTETAVVSFREDTTASRLLLFKLFPEHVVIVFSKQNEGALHWQNIRDVLRSCHPVGSPKRIVGSTTVFIESLPVPHNAPLLRLYSSELFAISNDVSFTAETLRPTQCSLGVVSRLSQDLQFFRLTTVPTAPASSGSSKPKDLSTVQLELIGNFRLKPGSHVEHLSVGRTGHRMVWLERSWETDAYELMKASFPESSAYGNRIRVNQLIPPHVALPFELHRCTAIWLEEATGRVCFGLHTGEIYLLEL